MLKKQHEISQHRQFSYRAIPTIFHSQTQDFVDYLEKDGMKFLKFWWDHTGNEVDVDCLSPMKGMTYEIREYGDGRRIVLLTLPPPQNQPEAFFLAMVTRPRKKHFLIWKNYSHVYALRLVGDLGAEPRTELGEITPRRVNYYPIGPGPNPDLDAFYEAVCKELIKAK
jgi:hypothetical protein